MDHGTAIRIGTILVTLASTAAARQALTLTGMGSNEQLGLELVAIGDRNGDGVPDFAAAANADYSPTGARVTAYSGANGATLGVIAGAASEWFGQAIASGDVNGDGFLEIVISAPRAQQSGVKVGKVGVYPVSFGTFPLWSQFSTFSGGSDFRALAVVDDRSGDGLPEVLVGTQSTSTMPRVDILAGTTGATLASIVASTSLFNDFGAAVAATGDIDLDGTRDYVVSAPLQSKVTIYSGTNDGILRTITWPFPEGFGRSIASLGDATGDGLPDLAIGVPSSLLVSFAGGATLLVSGATGAAHQLILPSDLGAGGQFGHGLADAGDLDGDGRSDVVIGAPYPHTDAAGGRVRIYSGATGSMLRNYVEPQSGAYFGLESAAIGDLDSDGRIELALGAPNWGAGVSSNEGRIQALDPMCGQAAIHGSSCPNPGTSRAITVAATGCFKSLSNVAVELTGNANTIGFVCVGLPAAPTPIGATGCSLHLGGPSLSFIPVVMPAIAGTSVSIPATLPAGLVAGTFAIQALEANGAVLYSASSALALTLF